MARLPDLVAFAQRHNIKIGTISDLIAYRRRHDNLVGKGRKSARSSRRFGGDWLMRIFTDETQGAEHIVLVKGDLITADAPVLVRMHALDPLEDVLGIGDEQRAQSWHAMQMIAERGPGRRVLLRDTDDEAGDEGEVSPRLCGNTGLAHRFCRRWACTNLVLLTNSPTPKVVGLEAYGLSITGTRAIPRSETWPH